MIKQLVHFIKREGDLSFWNNILFIVAISGMASSGILALVNISSNSAHNQTLNYYYSAIYFVLFLLFFIAKDYSFKHIAIEIEKIIKKSRDRISDKIIKCELVTMESLDTSSLFTRLTKDTTIISQASFQITAAVQSIVMVFFAMLYILTLSKIAFFIIIITATISSIIYLGFQKEFTATLHKEDKIEENFITSLTSIIEGFKEIKINSYKKDKILENHKQVLDEFTNSKVKTSALFITAIMYGEVFLYMLLAIIIFLLPHISDMESITMIQLTAATLYIIGPFRMIVNSIPLLSQTETAILNINALEKEMDDAYHKVNFTESNNEVINGFNNITLEKVEFFYHNNFGEKVFSIGPIDLNIKKGEMIFIVGGNGSGKSTFTKTLLGLYEPQIGSISVDDEQIDKYNYQAYRDLFSIILTDFHLFDKFYGLEDVDKKEVNKLLKEMQLNKKTKFIDGRFTNTSLSTGQRKRLALILAILEDKEIYVFDEWAADQDPEFRKYFYTTLLKKLKDRGKTIIAVTHDDAYFSEADRVFEINCGQINQYKGLE